MISFLKDENKEEKGGLSDLLIFLVIIALGVGGYFYFGHAEDETLEDYVKAEQLFKDKKFEDAYYAYNDLMDASWTSDTLDQVLYRNGQILDLIMYPPENIKPIDSLNMQWESFALLEAQYKKDTLAFIRSFVKPKQATFLRYDQFNTIEQWDSTHVVLVKQNKYFNINKELWEAKDSAWSVSDTTTFINQLDSIGTADYLTPLQVDTVTLWTQFKDSVRPDTTEN